MTDTQCGFCDKPLTGGTDTFGWPDDLCWTCYAELNSIFGDTIYGLGPHHHDLSITGHMIGSTVYDPLPEPLPDGGYDMGEAIYYPILIDDPDGRLGIWESKTPKGWR